MKEVLVVKYLAKHDFYEGKVDYTSFSKKFNLSDEDYKELCDATRKINSKSRFNLDFKYAVVEVVDTIEIDRILNEYRDILAKENQKALKAEERKKKKEELDKESELKRKRKMLEKLKQELGES